MLLDTDQVESTMLEKTIMMTTQHPFLANMEYIFQSDMRLYFVMPFIDGGELYKVYIKEKRFPEYVVKFYAAQIVLGIGGLHDQGFMHRDMKLENIMLDSRGYLKLIDFGLAKLIGQQAMTLCGTAEYMSPEMTREVGHTYSTDWWAVGILIYEMLIGITPFFNKNRLKLFQRINNSKVKFPDRNVYQIEYSDEITDLVGKLLDKDPAKRLGTNGGA